MLYSWRKIVSARNNAGWWHFPRKVLQVYTYEPSSLVSGSSFFRSSIRLREPSNSPSSIASYDNALNLPWEMAYIYATYSRYTLELRDRWAFTCEKKKQHQKNTGTRVEKWKFPAPLPNNCADEIAFRSYGLTWFKLRMCAPASHLYTLPLTASKREKKNREEIS